MPLDEIFCEGGLLHRHLCRYEYRPSQRQMAEAILQAIEKSHHLCVEAGTGTGKTLAYLIPALVSRKRILISTATRNLQEQIFFKDIPFLQEHLFPGLRAAYMKGRQNYLCLRRLYDRSDTPGLFERGEPWREELVQWAARTETGDRSELGWLRDEDVLWDQLDARSDLCVGQKCDYFEQCFVTRMRQRAFESDLIVVNHALLFANLAIESDEIGKVLPEFGVLILDEAHEVEDIAASHFGRTVSNYQLEELCRDCGSVLSPSRSLEELLGKVLRASEELFGGLPEPSGRYSLNFYRGFSGLQDLREEAAPRFQRLHQALGALYHHLQIQAESASDSEALIRRLERIIENLEEIFQPSDSDDVYWFERRGRGVFLHLTPIDVAPILREKLFDRVDTAILTSATLTTGGTFEYLKERLGLSEARELVVPAEFDYLRQTILYVPSDFPEPRSAQYFLQALRTIREILALTDGHAFLLFTSFSQLERIHRALEGDGYPLLRQGEMPKNQLLERFKRTPRAVLCATASFWQGVDVQGDALRAVIIDKLPFLVPSEPLVAARLHRLERRGENAFLRYSVPHAIITLKQGLGRLIRSRQDRGILAVLDSRLRTRRYGHLFFQSLPDCIVTDKIKDLQNFLREGVSYRVGGSPVGDLNSGR